MMMSHEQYDISDYERFHKYIAPAKEAYENAIIAGQKVSEKELEKVKWFYENLQYKLKKTDNSTEQIIDAYACVEGLKEIQDFSFHDSKPIYFEHQDNRALLKLTYEKVCITIEFTELVDVQVQGDPICNWIDDFYCYPLFHNFDYYYFDIGYYRITCKYIKVIETKRKP